MDIYLRSYIECVGEVTSNAWKIPFSMTVVSAAERPWRWRSLQDTTASSKVMEDGVVGSWRDRIMLQPTTNSSDGKSQGGAGTMLTPTVPINIMTFN